jgi:hypothetical protein
VCGVCVWRECVEFYFVVSRTLFKVGNLNFMIFLARHIESKF